MNVLCTVSSPNEVEEPSNEDTIRTLIYPIVADPPMKVDFGDVLPLRSTKSLMYRPRPPAYLCMVEPVAEGVGSFEN